MYSRFEVFRFCSILSSTMRGVFEAAVLSILTSLLTGTALARDPLKLDTDQPRDFATIQADQERIKSSIEETQCGGFNLQESVNGKIARVTGIPGRTGIWDGAKLSGMGAREDRNNDGNSDNDFQFPSKDDGAIGLTTVCKAGQDEIPKDVWRPGGTHPGEVVLTHIIFPHPNFEDPSCRWRVKVGAPTTPLMPKEDYDPPLEYGETTDVPNDRQSPDTCDGFCSYLNSWQYMDCALDPDKSIADGGMLTEDPITHEIYRVCPGYPDNPQDTSVPLSPNWEIRYLCSDQKVTDQAGACNPDPVDKANSNICEGNSCRCNARNEDPGNQGCMENPGLKDDHEAPVYYSYYRTYHATPERDPVPSDGPDDNTTLGIRLNDTANKNVACYGFYNEFDPKFHQTKPEDRRCVINVDVSGMGDSQKGKGNTGRDTNMNDINPEAVDQQRTARGSHDIWYMKLGWGFSLLNEDSFKNDYQNSLSAVFLDINNLDKATIKSSWPVDRVGEDFPHTAVSDRLRSFDDTGDRFIATWWQKQQSEVSVLLHPPVVRLLLPPTYAFGVDSGVLTNTSSSSSSASSRDTVMELNAKRSKSIEVQIDASEDMLGEALNSVQKSFLLHLEEEPIPVLVPMGSPTEFRAKAEAWCTWYIKKSGDRTCDNAPGPVKDLMKKLEDYADQIEHVRELRAELARYAGKVMTIQEDLTRPITDWMRENLTDYQEYLTSQKNMAKDVVENWRRAEQKMSDFENKTNLPWCMNQRYETPVFSFLDKAHSDDSWLPSRRDNGKISTDDLPNLTVPRRKDVIIDFSGITYMTGSLTLPVLKPVQVKITIPSPSDEPFAPLPDLPSIDRIHDALTDSLDNFPEVDATGTYDPLPLPPINQAEIDTVNDSIGRIIDTLNGMNDTYDAFWKSIGPLPGDTNPDTGVDGIKSMKEKKECKSWDDDTCQHVEMDLIERFQRIVSRKQVMLREDYDSAGFPRLLPNSCLPQDQACLLLHGEKAAPRFQWQITGPKTMPDITGDAKTEIRNATLPEPVGNIDRANFPPYDTDINSLLPFYDVPAPVELSPKK